MIVGELPPALGELAERLKRKLPDEFSWQMLDGALRVLADPANPVRLHLFAPAAREMMNHVLRVLAPNAEIELCRWFEPRRGKERIWRVDRASFIVRAGLPDRFVIDKLGFELEEATKGVADAVERLNELTHVNPTTLQLSEANVFETAAGIIAAFLDMFDAAVGVRDELSRLIVDQCPSAVFDAAISQTIGDIDELASSHDIEGPDVRSVSIAKLNATDVEFEASGELYATLYWGRGDDATEIAETFPFTIILRGAVLSPFELVADRSTLKVDNSGWYGVEEDPDEDRG